MTRFQVGQYLVPTGAMWHILGDEFAFHHALIDQRSIGSQGPRKHPKG
jgi:hypothetical protein